MTELPLVLNRKIEPLKSDLPCPQNINIFRCYTASKIFSVNCGKNLPLRREEQQEMKDTSVFLWHVVTNNCAIIRSYLKQGWKDGEFVA